MSGVLVFSPTGQPQGFQSHSMTNWDGNPEPVIREMLQNCLDAAIDRGREQAVVDFTIRLEDVDRIPGIKEYRAHFEAAAHEREKDGGQSGSELRTIQRIRRVLEEPETSVLYCRDNGVGLNADRMRRILTEGNTEKGKKGAGSYGVGHLTAFAASDLRMIQYAGRALGGGVHGTISSAHAVLASRTDGNRGRAATGYWLRDGNRSLFEIDESPYPTEVPPLLARELGRVEDTGSVVAVMGFNRFRDDQEGAAGAIARVAAKNFLSAIWQGRMLVAVSDEETGHSVTVDKESLGPILEGQREIRHKKGWMPSEQAVQAWRTLREGREIVFDEEGVRGFLRPLSSQRKRAARSRVQVFRSGMWITNAADRLAPRDFNGFKPFDAVLEIHGGEISRLARDAEGPEHRGLDRRRLGKAASRRLLGKLKEISRRLQEEAGAVKHEDTFVPRGFALLPGSVEREAEKTPRYRPGTGRTKRKKPIGPGGGKPRTPGFSPKPGSAAAGRCAVRAVPSKDGSIRRLDVNWRLLKDAPAKGTLALRVRVPSGSDETCVSPIGPKWLRIARLDKMGGGHIVHPGEAAYELPLPRDITAFTIRLADPISDANAVEVDIVRRRSRRKAKGRGQ